MSFYCSCFPGKNNVFDTVMIKKNDERKIYGSFLYYVFIRLKIYALFGRNRQQRKDLFSCFYFAPIFYQNPFNNFFCIIQTLVFIKTKITSSKLHNFLISSLGKVFINFFLTLHQDK